MAEPILTFPNQLTILRMICAPVFVDLTLDGHLRAAVAVFAIGALTDAFDGLIARFYKQRTALGAILDPIADKMLLAAAFIALTFAEAVAVRIPKWLTILVLTRDAIIVVSVAAIAFATNRRNFAPSLIGKWSTAAQMLAAGLTFIANLTMIPGLLLHSVYAATGALTVGSGLHYLYRASSRKPVEAAND